MRTFGRISVLFLAAWFIIAPAGAAEEKDVAGGRDHPLIARYPDSVIAGYAAGKDDYLLPLGKLINGAPEKRLELKGKATRITYNVPENKSTAEVFSSFEAAMKESGFDILFRAAGEDLAKYTDWPDTFYNGKHVLQGGTKDQRFLAARRTHPEGETYAALYVSLGWYTHPVVQLDVIDTVTLEKPARKKSGSRKSSLLRTLQTRGRVEIRSIRFDDENAAVVPGSEPLLREIADAMNKGAALKLYVVCHTANERSFEESMELSNRRAQILARTLAAGYGVDETRLKAAGCGPLSPLTANTTAAGRTKNTRIELIAQ